MEAPANKRHGAPGFLTAGEAAAASAEPSPQPRYVRGANQPVPAVNAFANGFLGGLVGGFAYHFAPAWLQLRELPFAGASILVLATILGAFEVWRVARSRTSELVRARLIVVLLACLIVLLIFAGFTSALAPPSQQDPTPVRMAPRKTVVC